ncbi:MAG: flagellar motor switch protein FliN [Limisphaerales bacterium]
MAEEDIQETTPNPEAGEATAVAEPPAADASDKRDEVQNLDFLLDVPVKLTAELGNCKMTMQELLNLNLGSVVQLDKPANANVDVYVNQKLVARGEVVVAEDNFGIRVKEIIAKPS